jgi:hypothetical protein
MKKISLTAVVLGGMLAAVVFAATVTAQTEDAKAAIRRAIELKSRQALKSQEWVIYVTPAEMVTGKKKAAPTVETDVLTFTDATLKSQNLCAQGYGESNFALSIGDDGTAVFETMQVNQNEDLAFLRGELQNNVIKGSMGMHPKKGAKRSFNFSTVKPEGK